MPTPPTASSLVGIALPAAQLSKAQQNFNRLTSRITTLRGQLAGWQAYQPRYNQRLATELQPQQAQLREGQVAMLHLLDQLLSATKAGEKLSKRHRRKALTALQMLASTVLGDGPDPAVEALHDKYSATSHQAQQRADLAEAEALFGEVLGSEALRGHGAETAEDLARHAAEHLAAQAEAEQARRAARAEARRQSGKRPTRSEATAQRQADAAKEASQSVREVFRKLASALHPDREPDPVARERKTRLMQRANDAYARDDLLTLLTLQIEEEQAGPQALASVPAQRLAHYNQVLRDQVKALEQEIDDITLHWRMAMGLGPWQTLKGPEVVDASLSQDIQQLRDATHEVKRDAEVLRDPLQRRNFLDAMQLDDEPEDDFSMLELAVSMGMFDDEPAPRRRRRRR